MKRKKQHGRQIKLKTFMQLGLSAIIIVIVLLFGTMYYFYTSELIQDNIQSTLRDFAVSAQYIIDGDLHEQIVDVDSDLFKEQNKRLAKFKEEAGIYDVYTLIKGDENKTRFVLASYDAESTFMEDYIYTESMKKAFEGQVAVTKEPYVDDFGTFYSGYAPLYNSERKLVAIVAVDINNDNIKKMGNELIKNTFLIIGITLLIGNIMVFFVSQYIGKYFKNIIGNLKKIGEGDLSVSNDEVSIILEMKDLGETINHMAEQISDLMKVINNNSKELHLKATHINSLVSTTDTSSQIISSAVEQMSNVHNQASLSLNKSLEELIIYDHISKESVNFYKDILESVQATKDNLEIILQFIKMFNTQRSNKEITENNVISAERISKFQSYCDKLYQDYDLFTDSITSQMLILDKVSLKREKLVEINRSVSMNFQSISHGNERIIESMEKQVVAIQGIAKEVIELEGMATYLKNKLELIKTK